MLVVLDTNIFLSGLIWGGNPKTILNGFHAEKFSLAFSEETFAELGDKIDQKCQEFPEIALDGQKYKKLWKKYGEFFPIKTNFTLCRDPKDNKFLDLVFACKADFLITGDKDLLTLKDFKKTKIVTPRKFIEAVWN